ncbi:MAG: hypothetical protein WBH28_04490 [Fuerstiella sp.]
MAGNSNPADDSPDFSFLGNDQNSFDNGPDDMPADSSEMFNFADVDATGAEPGSEPAGFGVEDVDVPDFPSPAASPPKVVPRDTAAPASEVHKAKPRVAANTEATAKPEPGERTRKLTPDKSAELPTSRSSDEGSASKRPTKQKAAAAEARSDAKGSEADLNSEMVSKKTFSLVAGYAAALTLLALILLVLGRVSLFGNSTLESLPDIRPLQNNEFQKVPTNAALPAGHTLKLGESRRFGDVILTAERVTREPVTFAHMTSGAEAPDMATGPVLKLWLKMENASTDAAFPPYELGLMCSRSPDEGTDDSTQANSWLMVKQATGGDELRVLNLLHSTSSSYDLAGQNSRKILQPGDSLQTFLACSRAISDIKDDGVSSYRWRVQFRKGVNRSSGNGVTTLVDIQFAPTDIQS